MDYRGWWREEGVKVLNLRESVDKGSEADRGSRRNSVCLQSSVRRDEAGGNTDQIKQPFVDKVEGFRLFPVGK